MSDLGFWISSITFTNSQVVNLLPGDILVFVGPNNAGKSQALVGIQNCIRQGNSRGPNSIETVKTDRSGEVEALAQYLVDKFPSTKNGFVHSSEHNVNLENARGIWSAKGKAKGGGWGDLTSFMVRRASALEQLGAVQPAEMFNTVSDVPRAPLQRMFMSVALEQRFSSLFKRAFGLPVSVNRGLGKQIALHLGAAPPLEGDETPFEGSYLKKFQQLPPLHAQGHGMLSFSGTLLRLITDEAFVYLLDEPEICLHPPQARLMGSTLASTRPPRSQLVLATHSGDLLRGLLEAPSVSRPRQDGTRQNVFVVRLFRRDDRFEAAVLDPAQLQRLWQEPMLRFSNVLDGLFHEGVVLCESDGDCRFYSAVLDAVLGDQDRARPSVMFAPTGGKHKAPAVAQALTGISVPVRVVLDLDALREESPLKELVSALGGDWNALRPDWEIVQKAVNSISPPLNANQVRQKIDGIFDAMKSVDLPEKTAEEIRKVLKVRDPWGRIKDSGISGFPKGQASGRLRSLLDALRKVGVFTVECGELEGFVPSIGNHGPRWVAEALERDLNGPEFEGARKFVRELVLDWKP